MTGNLAIIGGGPSGLSAAVNAAAEGIPTVLFGGRVLGGQARGSSRIENLLGFPEGISGEALASRSIRQAKRLGADIRRLAIPPDGINFGRDLISILGINFRAAIFATGMESSTLDIPGFSRRNVRYSSRMRSMRKDAGKPVVIVGGGNSAGQAALYLSGLGCAVTVLVRGRVERSMSTYLLDRIEADENVRIINGCAPREFDGRTVYAVEGGNSLDIPAATVHCFVGSKPASRLFPGAKSADGFIETDSLLTSIPNVLAIGDVRNGTVKRVASAVGDGSQAIRRAFDLGLF